MIGELVDFGVAEAGHGRGEIVSLEGIDADSQSFDEASDYTAARRYAELLEIEAELRDETQREQARRELGHLIIQLLEEQR